MSARESSLVAGEPELQSPRETETTVDAGASDWQKEVDVEGGTTIFHYSEKITAEKVPPYLSTTKKVPLYFSTTKKEIRNKNPLFPFLFFLFFLFPLF